MDTNILVGFDVEHSQHNSEVSLTTVPVFHLYDHQA